MRWLGLLLLTGLAGCNNNPNALKVYCESPTGLIVTTNPADTLRGCYTVATP